MLKLYLAGPDVFLPEAHEVGQKKQKLCRKFGFEGLFPLDNDVKVAKTSKGIFEANCALMRAADIGIFNCSPFRGPSVDPGTAFELGYLFDRGKPLWGYSNAIAKYSARVRAMGATGHNGLLKDLNGYSVEDFGLADNLMLVQAIALSGGQLLTAEEPGSKKDNKLAALAAFEKCLEALAKAIPDAKHEQIRGRRAEGTKRRMLRV